MERHGKYVPDRNPVSELLQKLEDYAADFEELSCELSGCMEEYMDDAEDSLGEAEFCLEGLSREHRLNRMLLRELNAGRKEMLVLLRLLKENGICPPEGEYLHHRRLAPELYLQNPDSPFYIQDPDEHFNMLLAEQMDEMRIFEETIPMTTAEREALREHIVRDTGLDAGGTDEWKRFLQNYRDMMDENIQEGR